MTYLKKEAKMNFPKPEGININMMPFIMGDDKSIPEQFKQYIPIIQKCSIPDDQIGKVGYLTVSESFVEKGQFQRRGGIHVEKHEATSWGGGGWGGIYGGLFMGSNISNSCRAWNDYVENPDEGGSLEDRENNFGKPIYMDANTLYWMTDGTPHEALPVKESQYRQFFRLVTNNVDLWYDEHSTSNPLGVEPDCEVIHENKFKE